MRIVILLLLVLPISLFAQNIFPKFSSDTWNFGVAAGLNTSVWHSSVYAEGGLWSSPRRGYSAQLFSYFKISKSLEVECRPGLTWVRYNAYYPSSSSAAPAFAAAQNSRWLEVPLFIRLRLFNNKKLFLEGGVVYLQPLFLSGEWTTFVFTPDGESQIENGLFQSSSQFNLHLGLGYQISPMFAVSLNITNRTIERVSNLTTYPKSYVNTASLILTARL
jgi:hypothetical protein